MKQGQKRFFGRPIGNTDREERQNRDSPICVTAHYIKACLSPEFFCCSCQHSFDDYFIWKR